MNESEEQERQRRRDVLRDLAQEGQGEPTGGVAAQPEARNGGTLGLAAVVLVFALLLRLVLILLGWPASDSDEGTMGLEALHILLRGEHPIFLYGQNYMGVAEAYLGAVFFHLVGSSLVALRLGMLTLFALFLVGVYLLAKMLYGRGVALVSLAFLSVASYDVMREQIMAVGGVAETLVCGAFLFVLACWLAATARQRSTRDTPAPWLRWRRAAAYAGWGVVAGLGLWSHLLIVPFLATSGLLLLVFCFRDLRSPLAGALLLGLVVGVLPLVIYNVNAAPNQNSLDVFLQIHQYSFRGAPTGLALLLREITGTVLWSVPMATGMSELWLLGNIPLFGTPSQLSWSCLLIQGGWGVGYLALMVWATVVAARPLLAGWRVRKRSRLGSVEKLETSEGGSRVGRSSDASSDAMVVTHTARFLLLVAAWLTLFSFMFSEIAAEKPWSQRYLIGFLVATPAILWPLLEPTTRVGAQAARRILGQWRLGVLAVMGGVLLFGTVYIFTTIPAVRAQNAQEAALARDLERAGITRIYAGYWVCDQLIFRSSEGILCGVVESDLTPGLNRYPAYASGVAASARTAYVFPVGSDFAHNFALGAPGGIASYEQRVIDGYVVFSPRGAT